MTEPISPANLNRHFRSEDFVPGSLMAYRDPTAKPSIVEVVEVVSVVDGRAPRVSIIKQDGTAEVVTARRFKCPAEQLDEFVRFEDLYYTLRSAVGAGDYQFDMANWFYRAALNEAAEVLHSGVNSGQVRIVDIARFTELTGVTVEQVAAGHTSFESGGSWYADWSFTEAGMLGYANLNPEKTSRVVKSLIARNNRDAQSGVSGLSREHVQEIRDKFNKVLVGWFGDATGVEDPELVELRAKAKKLRKKARKAEFLAHQSLLLASDALRALDMKTDNPGYHFAATKKNLEKNIAKLRLTLAEG